MAPKRGSTASPASRTPKAAKASPAAGASSAARSTPKRAAQAEPAAELTPLDLLRDSLTKLPLPEPCLEMLRASVPHLTMAPSSRHRYQAELAHEITGLFAREEAAKQSVVTALEGDAAALRTEDEGLTAESTTVRGIVDAAILAAAETAAAHTTLQEATVAAKAGVRTAQEHANGLVVEAAEMQKRREALEALMTECWEPTVGGAFAGKDWRKRDKAIASVVCEIQASAPGSLVCSTSAALKTKADVRGKFATQALVHCKTVLDEKVATVLKKIEGVEAEKATRAKAVSDAEEAFKAAEVRQDEAQEAVVAADKALAAAEKDARELKARQEDVAGRSLFLNKKLDAAKAALAEAAELTARAKALEEPVEAPAAAASEAPATAETPAETPAEEQQQ